MIEYPKKLIEKDWEKIIEDERHFLQERQTKHEKDKKLMKDSYDMIKQRKNSFEERL